jgi:hypothetical protein
MATTTKRPETTNPEVNATLEAIAREHLAIDTLQTRGRDRLDFHDCGVAGLRAALAAAYEAGRRHRRGTKPAPAETTVGDLVLIRRPETKTEGGWAAGRIGAFRFEALVFPQHADLPDYEIGRSRISKLNLRRLADGTEVYNWDRGLDRDAADQATRAAVDTITAQLANGLFGPVQE